MDFDNIPSLPPSKLEITSSDGGFIRFARENGSGADWRIYLQDGEGNHITTEFAVSGIRSPKVIEAISYGLRSITDPNLNMSHLPISESRHGRRLSDEGKILVVIQLIGNTVVVTLDSLNNTPNLDGKSKLSVTGTLADNTQRAFFQRLIGAMEKDNGENPLIEEEL